MMIGRLHWCDWTRLPSRLFSLAGLTIAAAVTSVFLFASGSAGAAGAACPSSNPPNELVVVAGSSQTAQLGKPFQTNLQVALANTNGCPLTGSLGGISVHFDAPGSGASGIFAGSGTNTVMVGTDAQGVATAPTFTANDTAGSYTVDVHSDYGSVELYLSNTASGLAASIAATGASQEATVNSQYTRPLQVQVLDANGKPVQGETINFVLGAGPYGAGASFLTGSGQASETTNADGVATSPLFVANSTPGRFTATASTSDLSTVATFSLDNHAAAETLSTAGDPAQTATIETRYAKPLTVRLLDPTGQPIEGATVTFTLGQASSGAGAGFLGGNNQATALTDVNGRASSPPFLANATPGAFTATATVPGITRPARYPLRNLAARLLGSRAAQTATVDHRYRPLHARVLDAQGRPVDGATVTFTLGTAASGASASFPDGSSQATETTDATGRASSPPLVANSSAGSFTATASLPGSKPLTFRLDNLAAQPASISAGAADGETTQVGSPFPIRLAVTVTDKNGNPVPDVTVVFTAPTHGPSGDFTIARRARRQSAHGKRKPVGVHTGPTVRVTTNGDGIAIAPPFTANRQTGGYIVTAQVKGSSKRAAFALVNQP